MAQWVNGLARRAVQVVESTGHYNGRPQFSTQAREVLQEIVQYMERAEELQKDGEAFERAHQEFEKDSRQYKNARQRIRNDAEAYPHDMMLQDLARDL
jgi:hypothetical protein